MNQIIRLEVYLSDDMKTLCCYDAQYDIPYGEPYVFAGKERTYIVFHQWPYYSVLRYAALRIAIKHYKGELKPLSLDLRTL